MMLGQLIQLPTISLLDKFGSGNHKPGSGSAAALMGILAGKLLITVASLTLSKKSYEQHSSTMNFINEEISTKIEPRLKHLFEQDSQVFDEVIKLRRARDETKNKKEKRKLKEQALANLKIATDIPAEICALSIKLLDHGIIMFDLGFKSARGDAGAAISAAVGAAMSSIFVINLNLKSFDENPWSKDMRERVEHLHKILEDKQLAAFSRVTTLKIDEVIEQQENQISFSF